MTVSSRFSSVEPRPFGFGPRRAHYFDVRDILSRSGFALEAGEREVLEGIDAAYRALCAILFNFASSGHPGGATSSGRIVETILYRTMDYDLGNPEADDADLLVHAAGHKAMGLYAMWALRNEIARIGAPELLPEVRMQLRLEDLLGFRRNPTQETPLFRKFESKALDGHPTPGTPFVRVATGPSGIGVPAALGLALGALDTYGEAAPWVNILEGEGGMTPGRVHEGIAAASSGRLRNVILHVDWNQASIDSNRVCRLGDEPGEYVQWDPLELLYCHDWNVIRVPDGTDFTQIAAAQEFARTLRNHQPTAIVYRTTKGWRYGIEGKASHGAGHPFCSEAYYKACEEFETLFDARLPRLEGKVSGAKLEDAYFETLLTVRRALEAKPDVVEFASRRLGEARDRLRALERTPREGGPNLGALYDLLEKRDGPMPTPAKVNPAPGESTTLRGVLGDVLAELNQKTDGAFIAAAADLLASTSVATVNRGFPDGLFDTVANPGSRLVAVGGICEDGIGAFMVGLSSFGRHIGVSSSYGAFITAMEHTAARVHSIGQQARHELTGDPYRTWIIINGHAGPKTGEDGPTHADPQTLQLLQENFADGALITLTPWDPREIWPLVLAGLRARPAVLCPFVTRPADAVVDREALRLPPPEEAVRGVYAMRRADTKAGRSSGTIVLQGNAVATIFVREVLPELDRKGVNLNVYYVASAELFNRLPAAEREAIFPESLMLEAMGITDFTRPTLYRWVRSNEGLRRSLYPFRSGRYLGSGKADKVLEEAGIHAAGQVEAILDYARAMEARTVGIARS